MGDENDSVGGAAAASSESPRTTNDATDREEERQDKERERADKRRDRRQAILLTLATAVIAALVSFGTNFLTAHQSNQAAERAVRAQEHLADQNFSRQQQQVAYQDFMKASSLLDHQQKVVMDAMYNFSRNAADPAHNVFAEWDKQEVLFDDLIAKEFMVDLIGSDETADAAFKVVQVAQRTADAIEGGKLDSLKGKFDDAAWQKVKDLWASPDGGQAHDNFVESGRRDMGLFN